MGFEQDCQDYLSGAERTVNQRDWIGYGGFFHERVGMRFPGAIDGSVSGRAARVEFVQGIMRTFPEGRIYGVRAFGVEPWGCCQFRFEGVNTGPIAGPEGDLPATGNRVAFPYCVVARFEDGVIVEFDEYFDQQELLKQLGLA